MPIFREGETERAKQPLQAHHKPASIKPKPQNQREADQLATRKTCATAAWAAPSLGRPSFDKLLQAPAPHRPDPATLLRFLRQLDFQAHPMQHSLCGIEPDEHTPVEVVETAFKTQHTTS